MKTPFIVTFVTNNYEDIAFEAAIATDIDNGIKISYEMMAC